MKTLREEAIAHFDSKDKRSFNEIYKGQDNLFEDVDDMIDPRFRKLFESVYDNKGKLRQLREMNQEQAAPFLEMLEDEEACEHLRQSLLKEIPLKVKKEIKQGLSEGSVEDMIKALTIHFGVESKDDVTDLSEKEQQEMMGSIMGICAVADRMDMIAEMIQAAIKLQEGLFRSTKTPIPRSKYVDNAQNRKLDRVGQEYGEQEYETEPGVIPGALMKAGEGISDFFSGIGGLIVKIVAAIAIELAPVAGLIHNICRMAIQDYGGGPGTTANIAGIVIFGLMCMPTFRGFIKIPTRESENNNNTNSKLFENIYKLSEEEKGSPGVTDSTYNFSGKEPGPSDDGVPGGHNRSGMGGSDGQTTQSKPGYHTNSQLGHEPAKGDSTRESFEKIYNDKHLQEMTARCECCNKPFNSKDGGISTYAFDSYVRKERPVDFCESCAVDILGDEYWNLDEDEIKRIIEDEYFE